MWKFIQDLMWSIVSLIRGAFQLPCHFRRLESISAGRIACVVYRSSKATNSLATQCPWADTQSESRRKTCKEACSPYTLKLAKPYSHLTAPALQKLVVNDSGRCLRGQQVCTVLVAIQSLLADPDTHALALEVSAAVSLESMHHSGA